jgi:hypothetical protein
MTSLQTSPKQVPINNGYFRVVPALVVGTNPVANVPYPVSSFMYTLTNGVLTGYTPQSAAVQLQLCTGQCLLKDMGVKFLSSSTLGSSTFQTFRRVQIVNTATGANTDGVSGTVTGVDADYDCAYIAMGFNGAVPAGVPAYSGSGYGPFIRTG